MMTDSALWLWVLTFVRMTGLSALLSRERM
jgi:hypothetical protein